MAKRKANSKKEALENEFIFEYFLFQKAIDKPRWIILNGKKVAIGADITIVPEPPRLPFKIPAANQDQLKALFEKGYTHLIGKRNVEITKPDSADN